MYRSVMLAVWVSASAALAGCGAPREAPPDTVDRVDPGRYAGVWYEIARIPNRFQVECVSDVTATYVELPGEQLSVINRCTRADGEQDTVRGTAQPVVSGEFDKLEVSFVSFLGTPLLWSDYWILQLGEDYEYAVVGTPDRSFGWILSREPTLPPQTREIIDQRLIAQGYDPADFQDTAHPQTEGTFSAAAALVARSAPAGSGSRTDPELRGWGEGI